MSALKPMIEFEVDDDGYPSEDSLEAIVKLDGVKNGWLFMVEEFPRLAGMLPCNNCDVSEVDDGIRGREIEVRFATGGWSGCESFVGAVLQNTMLRMLYYAKWERGGLHVFRMPVNPPKQGAAK